MQGIFVQGVATGMSVLLTGATGFVGLATAEALLLRGEDVIGYDVAPLPDIARRIFATLPGRFRLVPGDVCDGRRLSDTLRRFGVGRLIHLAAIAADEARERTAPGAILAVNVGGTVEVVQAAIRAGVARMVHLSSAAVYGSSGRSTELLAETAPLVPEGLYGISKQAGEAAALRLASLQGLDLVAGRLGTCFGRWEYDTAVRDTPSAPYQVMRLARAGGTAILPRACRRDWLYARDAAAAVLALLDCASPRQRLYNLSAGYVWTLAELCALLARGFPAFSWRIAEPSETANIDCYAPYDRAALSTDRLLADTGFQPLFDLPSAAEDYLSWLAVADER
jgi:UDP-glucuronate 4-epimerase